MHCKGIINKDLLSSDLIFLQGLGRQKSITMKRKKLKHYKNYCFRENIDQVQVPVVVIGIICLRFYVRFV